MDMRHARRRIGVLLLLLMAASAPCWTARSAFAEDAADALFQTLEIQKFDAPEDAPAFSLASTVGGEQTLADFKGKVVLLNFWATWCPYCRAERPALQAVYEKYKDKGLVVVAISIDKGAIDPVKKFVEDTKQMFPNLHNPSSDVGAQYSVRGIPTTYLIDKAGKMRGMAVGPRPWDDEDADKLLEGLLSESGKANKQPQEAKSGATAEK